MIFSSLQQIPIDVIHYIRQYINYKEWHQFLHTSKCLDHLKRQTLYMSLTSNHSFLYMTDTAFREEVRALVANPFYQLKITISFTSSPLVYDGLSNLHTLSFFVYLGSIDLSHLSSINYLQCRECHTLENATSVFRSSSNIHNVDFSYSRQINDSYFVSLLEEEKREAKEKEKVEWKRAVKSLNLSNCFQIKDISAFQGLQKLVLQNCDLISDVSSLSETEYVDLTNCYRITNVSALSRCQTLVLDGCLGVKDVNMLGNVHHLSLKNCYGIYDVSGLGNKNYHVDLTNCRNIEDISSFKDVAKLVIDGCSKIKEVNHLRKVTSLSMKGCSLVEDINLLISSHSILYLNIVSCQRVLVDQINASHVKIVRLIL
jgi:hypothetical protein